MNELPDLTNANRTLKSLRGALQPLRSARLVGSEILPNYANYSLEPKPYGASTGELSYGGELQIDYAKAKVIYRKDDSTLFTVDLNGENQVALAEKVFGLLKEQEADIEFDTEKIVETAMFEIDEDEAGNYAQVQQRVAYALLRVREQLGGYKSPLVLWPHGFDLSFLWFNDGQDESKDPHMNFGFSPGIGEDEPYLYFYGWPTLVGTLEQDLPDGGEWQSNWSAPGVKFGYSHLQQQDNPEEYIEKLMLKLHNEAKPTLSNGDKK